MLMNSSIKDLLLQKDAHTHCCEHVRYACLDMHEFNSRNRQVELGEEKGFRGTTEPQNYYVTLLRNSTFLWIYHMHGEMNW